LFRQGDNTFAIFEIGATDMIQIICGAGSRA
jgi:hypothetical protein